MARPHKPNTVPAAEARRQIGFKTAIAKLTNAGYQIIHPHENATRHRLDSAVDWLVDRTDPNVQKTFRALAEGLIDQTEAGSITTEEIDARRAALEASTPPPETLRTQ